MPVQRTDKARPIVDRPIFVVGVGRTGSTVFHRTFSEHPRLAWQSPFCDLFPARPAANRGLLNAIDWPLIGRFLRRNCKPGERYRFWDYYCRGFSQPCRDLLCSDVTLLNKRRIPPALAQLVTSNRPRLLIKLTGWPRVGFLHELFPDAKFIHVYRDGRAVANSLLAVHFWDGWSGPTRWRYGDLDPMYRVEWERHGKSFVALAGIQWKMQMAAMDEALKDISPAQFMQVRYEDFVEDPVACFRKVGEFCELEWPERFEKSIRATKLRATNDKWREDLTKEQQAILESVLAESLSRYGYPVTPSS